MRAIPQRNWRLRKQRSSALLIAIWIDPELVIPVCIAGTNALEVFRLKCKYERTKVAAATLMVEVCLSRHNVILHDVQQDKYGSRLVACIAYAF